MKSPEHDVNELKHDRDQLVREETSFLDSSSKISQLVRMKASYIDLKRLLLPL